MNYYGSFIKATTNTFPTQTGVENENIITCHLFYWFHAEKKRFCILKFQICAKFVNLVVFAIIYQKIIPRSIKWNNK